MAGPLLLLFNNEEARRNIYFWPFSVFGRTQNTGFIPKASQQSTD